MAAALWIGGMTLIVAVLTLVLSGCTDSAATAEIDPEAVVPFTDIASSALGENSQIDNHYPGVAIFDFDRDGDLDFYVSVAEGNAWVPVAKGGPNLLFRNDGDNTFTEVAEQAGLTAFESNGTSVVACDVNNDGYQDLYLGAEGRIGDKLDYRSVDFVPGLRGVVKDRLFVNNGDGTFRDVTDSAFGFAANIRSVGSVACADVNGDGWLDLFVGNRGDVDFVRFDTPRHHGHHNVLFRNDGDLTFTNVMKEAGLWEQEIVMRDPLGAPITFNDALTGVATEGYDPELRDALGSIVGDPTGETWSILFFDHDDDGDPDLWLADDGDRLKIYRNDSDTDEIRFTSLGRAMGLDESGAWMGFALGDYDGDADLDVFVTNIGYHPLTRRPPQVPGGDCAYSHRFDWGTCFHYLLRNDGMTEIPGLGTVGDFVDVAGSTKIKPSRVMPPDSLDPSRIHRSWQVPTGLNAYDFGFGTAFFDYENDGDQDLYWVGSIGARGEGPRGMLYPGAGRMLRNRGDGSFEDITAEAHLIDAQGVDYSVLDPDDPRFDAESQRIGQQFHENGKGLAKGDLNGDGYIDLIATNSSGEIFNESGEREYVKGPLFVWMNSGGDRRWITIRLTGRMGIDGTGSNADAVGARIYLKARVNDGEMATQVQDVLASSSFMSMNSLDVSFGLGTATKVEEITIRWPSGILQSLSDVDVNQVLEVTEPKD